MKIMTTIMAMIQRRERLNNAETSDSDELSKLWKFALAFAEAPLSKLLL